MIIRFGDVLLFGLMLVSMFLTFIILIQRGRGGGLAGAFGGQGDKVPSVREPATSLQASLLPPPSSGSVLCALPAGG
jgi:protein translocase SecG subunit